MSQKCYNFVAEFINNANMEEKKSDLIEGLNEYLDNASKEELDELEKYNQFGPVVNISEYYLRANNMDMEQRREAFKLAFEWIRNIPLCDCDIDLATAYAEGVIYGWNNPNWIKIEDGLPPHRNQTTHKFENDFSVNCFVSDGKDIDIGYYDYRLHKWNCEFLSNVVYWYCPQSPRKEDKK